MKQTPLDVKTFLVTKDTDLNLWHNRRRIINPETGKVNSKTKSVDQHCRKIIYAGIDAT